MSRATRALIHAEFEPSRAGSGEERPGVRLQEAGRRRESEPHVVRSTQVLTKAIHVDRPNLMLVPTHVGVDDRASVTRVGETRHEPDGVVDRGSRRAVGHETTIEMANVWPALQNLGGQRIRNAEVENDSVLRKVPNQLGSGRIGLPSDPESAVRTVLEVIGVFEQIRILAGLSHDGFVPTTGVGLHDHPDAVPNERKCDRPADLGGRTDEVDLLLADLAKDTERLLDDHRCGERVAVDQGDLEPVTEFLHDPLATVGQPLGLVEGSEADHCRTTLLRGKNGVADPLLDALAEPLDQVVIPEVVHGERVPGDSRELELVDHGERLREKPVQLGHEHEQRRQPEKQSSQLGPPVQEAEDRQKPVPGLHVVNHEGEPLVGRPVHRLLPFTLIVSDLKLLGQLEQFVRSKQLMF